MSQERYILRWQSSDCGSISLRPFWQEPAEIYEIPKQCQDENSIGDDQYRRRQGRAVARFDPGKSSRDESEKRQKPGERRRAADVTPAFRAEIIIRYADENQREGIKHVV